MRCRAKNARTTRRRLCPADAQLRQAALLKRLKERHFSRPMLRKRGKNTYTIPCTQRFFSPVIPTGEWLKKTAALAHGRINGHCSGIKGTAAAGGAFVPRLFPPGFFGPLPPLRRGSGPAALPARPRLLPPAALRGLRLARGLGVCAVSVLGTSFPFGGSERGKNPRIAAEKKQGCSVP